jgi:mono/diheme cytochrome c family protein
MVMQNGPNGTRSSSGSRWIAVAAVAMLSACAIGTTSSDVLSPLGAHLTPSAATGTPVALRFDPTAKVIISTASGLPNASYLESQADRGAQTYSNTCGTCHGPGTLVGEGFVAQWNNRRVYDLYALVRSTMPLDNPGGMKDGEYLDVIAYLLRANKHASARADSLRADTTAMRKTKISVGSSP